MAMFSLELKCVNCFWSGKLSSFFSRFRSNNKHNQTVNSTLEVGITTKKTDLNELIFNYREQTQIEAKNIRSSVLEKTVFKFDKKFYKNPGKECKINEDLSLIHI